MSKLCNMLVSPLLL